MGSISDLVTALSLLGITRAWNAQEDDRRFRQEEAFVPFRLPPLIAIDNVVEVLAQRAATLDF
jgi:hypothetical protein